ncbi:MAG: hypothetical protein QOF49_819, partial [Chloroflexota bacterium]|nr:hypothetical protein [Chloroflexota bacterium]
MGIGRQLSADVFQNGRVTSPVRPRMPPADDVVLA